MTNEERILVEDLIREYKTLVDYMRQPQNNSYPNLDYNEVGRREAKIDGIRQSLSSILKCSLQN